MREVEVKARLNDKEGVMKKLLSLVGCAFEDKITQDDTVYTEKVGDLATFLSNKIFLRLRVKNGEKIIFTLKKTVKDLDKIEHEAVVSSREEMEQALFAMGYQTAARVKKERVITHHNGWEICIDDVENLGSFIEVEKMIEDGDSLKVQEELFAFLVSLGVRPEDRVTKGYDILMLEKKSR